MSGALVCYKWDCEYHHALFGRCDLTEAEHADCCPLNTIKAR